jgi:hypothetical protein
MARELEKPFADDCKTCRTESDGQGRGWLYAWATAVLCPCHMPLWGILLGGTVAGAFFEQHFWSIAVGLGVMTLLSLYKAVRILL